MLNPPGKHNNCFLEAMILASTNTIGTENKLEQYRKEILRMLRNNLEKMPIYSRIVIDKWTNGKGISE